MTIGAVLSALREDFPDVTISKIRFLETEGLVSPERTGSGYRTYSGDDVERLRYVLTAQRDRFWPLKVIREALDAMDRGLQPPDAVADGGPTARVPDTCRDPALPAPTDLTRTRRLRLTAAELSTASGLEASTLEALETFGLVRPDDEGYYGEPELAVAKAAGALASFGLEARHLRPFRSAADREIGLVQQVVRPVRGRGRDRAAAASADPTGEVLAHCIALHAALVRAGLHRS